MSAMSRISSFIIMMIVLGFLAACGGGPTAPSPEPAPSRTWQAAPSAQPDRHENPRHHPGKL